MTFYEWAMQKNITDTPNGDFLQDMRYDHTAKDVLNEKDSWELHLSSACAEAKEVFQELWSQYRRSGCADQPSGISYVYFIKANNQLFKIGRTNFDPYKRLATMQTGSPIPLSIYRYVETKDSKKLESELHRKFSEYRLNGEWFSITSEDIDESLEQVTA